MIIVDPNKPATFTVRIKIVVWPDGSWTAYSDHIKNPDKYISGGETEYWITAEIPMPADIKGEVQ
jgi:hypothetical protein